MSDDDSNPLEEHDLESLKIAQEEARAVLDHQIDTFRNVDDKAARTFRLVAILLGLILTAVSFLGRSNGLPLDPYINIGTISGIVFLIISFTFAVITFTVTNIQTGIGPSAIQRLVDKKYSEKHWLILILRSEAAWMKYNDRQQSINGILLTISHVSLIIAVLSLSIGAALPHLPI